MTLFLYGAFLRERAIEILSLDLVEAASLYRKAAGVYEHLAQDVLPDLEPKLPMERPPEVMSSTASAMCLICLADAQAAAAWKAESRANTSRGVLAKLHYGIVQMLEEAVAALRQSVDWNDLSDRFKRFLSGCNLLHEARSRVHIARELKEKDQLGVAVGVLQYAMRNIQGKQPAEEPWKKTYKQELESVGELLRRCEHENDFIWHHKIPPSDELPILEGKRIVAPIKYELVVLDREFIFVT
eukprot:TRINITY_DN10082_c0_g1_i1.p1 TRINITY_DN10082_c0_g1~~TRINITY_DN10082_c0_g1_i1.p1  ORF type:complete len:242 (+),score=61.38 TRINITY_DN10082_c0_g1_i1:251-976(+)